MDKNFWNTIGLIILISNGLAIVVLFETLLFSKPFVSLFIMIFFVTYRLNEGLFKKTSRLDSDERVLPF